MNTKPITVQNAEISTVAVQIETITVNRKQMTLSMFRQLRDEQLVTAEGNFRGNPWGTVNYHPSGNCHKIDREHLHVVWQLGGELRRATVYQTILDKDLPSIHDKNYGDPNRAGGPVSRYVQAVFCANGHQLPSFMRDGRSSFMGEGVTFSFAGVDFISKIQPETHPNGAYRPGIPGTSVPGFGPPGPPPGFDPPACKATAIQVETDAANAMKTAAASIRNSFATWLTGRTENLNNRMQRWDELNALPQLFIGA